jgi:hypothetical protein
MRYDEALAEARRVGASKAEGDALLAQTASLVEALGAFVPKWVYAGAKATGMSPKQLVKAMSDNGALNDLQWVGSDAVRYWKGGAA